jgi:flagellar basal body-associated protein FliL
MADENELENQQDTQEEQQQNPKIPLARLLPWIIMALAVVICASIGFGLGRVFASRRDVPSTELPQQQEADQTQMLKAEGSETSPQNTWYYDLEPVVANLNEPDVTRYIRISLTLQISNELDSKKTTAFLEQKAPLIKDWLTIYLASQTLEDIRGEGNLRRIQSQMLDAFNEKLFPDTKPQIKNVLFKEFAVQ